MPWRVGGVWRTTIAARGRTTTPRLQSINKNGTHTVIFSEDDLTRGLLGTETRDVSGYTPDCAIALIRNIILYVLSKDVPTTQTTQPKPN